MYLARPLAFDDSLLNIKTNSWLEEGLNVAINDYVNNAEVQKSIPPLGLAKIQVANATIVRGDERG